MITAHRHRDLIGTWTTLRASDTHGNCYQVDVSHGVVWSPIRYAGEKIFFDPSQRKALRWARSYLKAKIEGR